MSLLLPNRFSIKLNISPDEGEIIRCVLETGRESPEDAGCVILASLLPGNSWFPLNSQHSLSPLSGSLRNSVLQRGHLSGIPAAVPFPVSTNLQSWPLDAGVTDVCPKLELCSKHITWGGQDGTWPTACWAGASADDPSCAPVWTWGVPVGTTCHMG